LCLAAKRAEAGKASTQQRQGGRFRSCRTGDAHLETIPALENRVGPADRGEGSNELDDAIAFDAEHIVAKGDDRLTAILCRRAAALQARGGVEIEFGVDAALAKAP